MAEFEIAGARLEIPDEMINPKLRKALETGRYEGSERAALKRHVRPGDRVLDLGAGAGLVSILAAEAVGAENVTSVEASPAMVPVLRRNLDNNFAAGARVRHGAVVASDFPDKVVRFRQAQAFWASQVAGEGDAKNVVEVPALRFGDLVAEARPTIVTMDIEGAEVEICQESWPAEVRILIMEIHPGRTPPERIKTMFDALSRAGFTYMPWGTRGSVVVQQRVPAP